ncbi:hypothetical protein GGF31_008277 [Allomyces arbusculus]|nr:hypothetical protein GGF31_008277 [Allomyces arbusculus]
MDPSGTGSAQQPLSPVTALAARCEHAALASPASADADTLASTAVSPPPSSSASTPTPTLAPAAEPDATVPTMTTPGATSATIAERRRRRSLRVAARTAANIGIGTPRSRGGRRMSTSSIDSAAGIVSPASTPSDSFSFAVTTSAAEVAAVATPSSPALGVTSPGVTSLGVVSPGQLHAMSEDDTMGGDEDEDDEPMDVEVDHVAAMVMSRPSTAPSSQHAPPPPAPPMSAVPAAPSTAVISPRPFLTSADAAAGLLPSPRAYVLAAAAAAAAAAADSPSTPTGATHDAQVPAIPPAAEPLHLSQVLSRPSTASTLPAPPPSVATPLLSLQVLFSLAHADIAPTSTPPPERPECTCGNCDKDRNPADDLPSLSLADLVASLPLASSTLIPTPDAAAMTSLGESLLYGASRNRPRALDLFVRAADLGDAKAMGIVGFMLEFGLGGHPPSFERCEPYYQAAAARGHALSMTRLAFLKRYGRPAIKMDKNEANLWVVRTRALVLPGAPVWACNAPAKCDASPRMKEGSDRETDPLAWLWWAATTCGCSAAQYALGTCYHDGVGLKRDPKEAVVWYRKSAEQGEPRGQGILGFCYGEAFGVDLDAPLAIRYYLQAAMQGETVAMYNVGFCYEEGTGMHEPNLERAYMWYRHAAEAGNALAANSLGFMFEEGRGVPQDMELAVFWYRYGASLGNPWAQHNLGWMYAEGIGVPRQLDEAFKWLLVAAQQDHAGAMFRVGQAYQLGLGVRENPTEAVFWYSKSAKLRNLEACLAMAWCAEHGYGIARDPDAALEWMDAAIRAGAAADDDTVLELVVAMALRLTMSKQGARVRALVEAGVAGPCPAAE